MYQMRRWNARQIHVFRRYGRRFGVALTPDLVLRLVPRYAEKHVRQRGYATA